MRARTLLLAALLLLPLLPVAPAAEPDTARDRHDVEGEPSWWVPSPTGAYFDFTLVPISAGALASLVPAGHSLYRGYVYFGQWTDCDQDGQVGWGAAGLISYPRAANPGAWSSIQGYPCDVDGGKSIEMTVFTDGRTGPGLLPYGGLVWADFGWPGDTWQAPSRIDAGEDTPLSIVLPGTPVQSEPKRKADLTFSFHPGSKSAFMPRPDHPAYSTACSVDECRGWWSREIVALPDDPSQLVGLRTVAYGWLGDWSALQPKPEDAREYAAERCPNGYWENGGIHNGWDCNNHHWSSEPYIGQPYWFRDHDDARSLLNFATDADRDTDHLGDAWEEKYGGVQALVSALDDLDRDCLANGGEFAWGYIPVPMPFGNAQDYDGDGLGDADEVDHWNNPANDEVAYYSREPGCPNNHLPPGPTPAPGIAPFDADALLDTDADLIPNHLDPDSDNDTLSDGDELHRRLWNGFGSDPALADTDVDGLSDAAEAGPTGNWSDPRDADSDNDTLDDLAEWIYWQSYLPDTRADVDGDGKPALMDADSDNDALGDADERLWETLPHVNDTDGDGMPDGWEVRHRLKPLDSTDAADDIDGDNLTNLDEHEYQTNPRSADTDLDNLADDAEIHVHGTNPARWDTDGDGMPDGWEKAYALDPLDASDAEEDPDQDSSDATGALYVHTNAREYRAYRLPTWNESTDGVWWNGTDPGVWDTDEDGVGDGEEVATGQPANLATPGTDPTDSDQDGLSNADEIRGGLDPTLADTDGDGLCDGGYAPACRDPHMDTGAPGETNGYGSTPHKPHVDSDLDGLTDWQEAERFVMGADTDGDSAPSIIDWDSDDDGLDDGREVQLGANPLLADTDQDGLSDADEIAYGTNPTHADPDQDGLDDHKELRATRTDPNRADPDEDLLADGEEIARNTDPWRPDTDQDAMLDGWESRHNLNPLEPTDADLDQDQDQLTNRQEQHHGTNPWDADTDDDQIPDGIEVALGLSPTVHEARAALNDIDGDSLSGYEEYLLGTNPESADTDDDGLTDWDEARGAPAPLVAQAVAHYHNTWPDGVPRYLDPQAEGLGLHTDPTLADTDDDGIYDGLERELWTRYGPDAETTPYHGQPEATFTSNLREADADADGLDDGAEFLTLGTDPRTPDMDGDTWQDGEEVRRGSDPRDPTSTPLGPAPEEDADHDGLTYAQEAENGTAPDEPDTDHDGLDDGHELLAWKTRLNTTYEAIRLYARIPDTDADGVNDGEEFAFATLSRQQFYLTDPSDPDTDDDGLLDGQEARNSATLAQIAHLTQDAERKQREITDLLPSLLPSPAPAANDDTLLAGTWGTTIWNAAPANTDQRSATTECTGPEPSPSARDSDHDHVRDGIETPYSDTARGDPCTQDSDNDDILDWYEIHRTPQTDIDNDGRPPALDADMDNDGLPDGKEDTNRNGKKDPQETNALDQDTDDDGLMDETEIELKTNAISADHDGDGLPDGFEYGLASPESTLPALFGTDTQAELLCTDSGISIGPTWRAWPRDMTTFVNPQNHDSDGDGIIDGIEDFDRDGIFGYAGNIGSRAEYLPSMTWLELNPRVPDSDGDGLSDGEELQMKATTYCSFANEHHGNMNDMAAAIGYPEDDPRVVNPHAPDTDGDGVMDDEDVDPRSMMSLLMIERLDYQQLERTEGACEWDWCTEDDAYAPDLAFSLTLRLASGNLPIVTPQIDNFLARSPRSLLDQQVHVDGGSLSGMVFQQLANAWQISLPQASALYGGAASTGSLELTAHAVDVDKTAHDAIDFTQEAGEDYVTSIPVYSLAGPTIDLTTSGGTRYQCCFRDAAGAALTLQLNVPLKKFFFERATGLVVE